MKESFIETSNYTTQYTQDKNIFLQFLVDELEIDPDLQNIGMSEYFDQGNILLVVCFFLVCFIFHNKDHAAFLEEINQLKAAMDMEEKDKDEWFKNKYLRLKKLSGVSENSFLFFDAIITPRQNASLADALKALKAEFNSTPKQTL